MDLDVIVLKNFNNTDPNFAGPEGSDYIAAGIIGFEHNEIGHEMAELCVR